MTKLELLKEQAKTGFEFEAVRYKLGNGCWQDLFNRQGEKEKARKIWQYHCRHEGTKCEDCRCAFWDTEVDFDLLESLRGGKKDQE